MLKTLNTANRSKPMSAEQRVQIAKAFDLSKPLARFARQHPELVPQLTSIHLGLIYYFALLANSTIPLRVPNEAIDTLWHEFILFTKMYAEFCELVVGRFVHHNPFDETVTSEQRKQMSLNLYKASMEAYGKDVFNIYGTEVAICQSCIGDIAPICVAEVTASGPCSHCDGNCGDCA